MMKHQPIETQPQDGTIVVDVVEVVDVESLPKSIDDTISSQ